MPRTRNKELSALPETMHQDAEALDRAAKATADALPAIVPPPCR